MPRRAGLLPHLQLPCYALVTVPARSPASVMTAGSFQTGKGVVTQNPLFCQACRKPSPSPQEAVWFPPGEGRKWGTGKNDPRRAQTSRRWESRSAGSNRDHDLRLCHRNSVRVGCQVQDIYAALPEATSKIQEEEEAKLQVGSRSKTGMGFVFLRADWPGRSCFYQQRKKAGKFTHESPLKTGPLRGHWVGISKITLSSATQLHRLPSFLTCSLCSILF